MAGRQLPIAQAKGSGIGVVCMTAGVKEGETAGEPRGLIGKLSPDCIAEVGAVVTARPTIGWEAK